MFIIAAVTETIQVILYKNSAPYLAYWLQSGYTGSSKFISPQLNTLIVADNITDTFELKIITDNNQSVVINGTMSYHYISQ